MLPARAGPPALALGADVSLYPQREAGERLVANFLASRPSRCCSLMEWMRRCRLSLQVTSDPKTKLLFADPTFVMYPTLGEALGAQVVRLHRAKIWRSRSPISWLAFRHAPG